MSETLKRRNLPMLAVVAAMMLASAGCCSNRQPHPCNGGTPTLREASPQASQPETPITPQAAEQRLKDGNRRFTAARLAHKDLSASRRRTLAAGQNPFAVIVCCSDSRVPPELVFDQGLGDIFVVRVAGNVVDPVVLGSVEYAAEHLHAPLIVVLGHEDCGAVKAAIQGGEAPGDIGAIVEKIQGSVKQAAARGAKGPAETDLAVHLNIRNSVAQIEASPIVSHLAKEGKVNVVGAKYHLQSGRVEWFCHCDPAEAGAR